ncbi:MULTISPECIES: DUF3054 domain-containing protein [unclassified Haladaptatus]|uniref:DUF3054 domain-containing protein n=1 Tax=unclassified Haladaptatus TaxID=2622732 RepID=UPI0023E8B4D0|nr:MULTISPECIES: DUF3054 domain-containing protein [unclassified Haladaptatus]
MSDTASARVAATPRTALLALGDLALIALFVFLGQQEHGTEGLLMVAAPFLIGWLLVAPLVGLYDGRQYDLKTTVGLTAGAWVGAALIGQALRATEFFPGGLAIAFVIVSIVVGLVLLVPFRALVAYAT